MKNNSLSSNDEIYTGTLRYQGEDYHFALSGAKLRLIPTSEEKRAALQKLGLREIKKGIYTLGNQPRMEEDVLIGSCYENGKPIIFLPQKNAYISIQNLVLLVDLKAYIICTGNQNSFSRISFTGPEINCIHPTNQAIECSFDAETFVNSGTFSVAAKDFERTTTQRQSFVVDGKTVSVYFGVSRTMSTKIWEPPMTLSSNMMFEFEATDDYQFVLRLWYIAKQFIQLLCYRKNIQFDQVKLAAPYKEGKYQNFAEVFVLDKGEETEIQTLKNGRYIRQTCISGHEGQILSDIANNKVYLRHLPESFRQGQSIDAARFVMITAAFEWEFNRLFPDGISKSEERVAAELEVSQKLRELIDANSGKTKKIYKSLLYSINHSSSLSNKIEEMGRSMGSVLEPFGKQLYEFNQEQLSYPDMGKRLADQRNHFAHGDLDQDFIGLSLLDLIFLERIIYAMQLKGFGLEDKQIQSAINDLFQCRFAM